ncbi:MAG: hypothetical protein AAGA54_16710 [Myxococcota bacterium]
MAHSRSRASKRPFGQRASRRSLSSGLAAMLALGAVAASTACRSETPEPKKVSEVEPTIEPKVRPERQGPFADPNAEPPPPRSEPQLGAEALATTMRTAKDHAAAGRATVAIQTLRACANKVPQDVACEAEIGLMMLEAKQQRAHAHYYIAQAATAEPAEADDALYRRLGAAAMKAAQFETARAAYGVLRARDVATVDELMQYAHALQADASTTDEAADVYARAYELDGTKHELLRKRATLLAQAGDHARAADLFEQYLEAAQPQPREKNALQTRVAQLRQLASAEDPGSKDGAK